MPTSVLLVAERAITFAGTIQPAPRRILDVGPGWGKYGVLLREYLDPTPMWVDAVEAWPPYIVDHRLEGIYDTVHHGFAEDLDDVLLMDYDLVTMGDVIEHMEKDAALDFLSRCPGWVVIATPVVHFHTDEGLPPTEAHVSHWTMDDFNKTGRVNRHEVSYGALIVRLSPLEDS
jgi:cyclopropane fatty-acyl-phospholipid synthase-like methyltransferase